MSQTKAELIKGLNINASAPATSLQIDASGNVNIDSNTLYVDATNNRVGIGTTSPLQRLHVCDATATDGTIRLGSEANYYGQVSYDYSSTYYTTYSNYHLGGGAGGHRFLVRQNNEAVRIDTSGRLLVGTSTSRSFNTHAGALQIDGDNYSESTVAIVSNSNASDGAYLFFVKQRSGSAGGSTVVQNNDIIGEIRFNSGDGTDCESFSGTIQCLVDGTPGSNDVPGRLVFSTTADGASSPTERMRIASTGSVQITNNTDNNNNGVFNVTHNGTSGQQYGIYIKTNNDQNGLTTWFLTCIGGSTERATIRTNGGLANYQSNNVNLSDRNAKKDISPAAGTWECIKEWEIVNYRYKDQPDDADLNLGVIAQQVAESCPEVITVFQEAKEATEDQPAQEERLGVKEQQMYWMAIKALQEAMSRIETLEAKVAALKAQ